MVRMASLVGDMSRHRRPFLHVPVGRLQSETTTPNGRSAHPTIGTAGHFRIMLSAYQRVVLLMALSGLLVMKFLREVSRQMFMLLIYMCLLAGVHVGDSRRHD